MKRVLAERGTYMANLKESLLKEQNRLEKILRKAEKQLMGWFIRILHFYQEKQNRKFIGSMTAEWMILCMPKTQSEKSWHMRKTEYIPVRA